MDHHDMSVTAKGQAPIDAGERQQRCKRIENAVGLYWHKTPEIPQPGYISARVALNRLGKALYSNQWLGIEFRMMGYGDRTDELVVNACNRGCEVLQSMRWWLAMGSVTARA
ncbi:MAG: hypothetical protein AAGA21_21995 [Pseudomonadota bacterium]